MLIHLRLLFLAHIHILKISRKGTIPEFMEQRVIILRFGCLCHKD
jgi:hypothetical protein